jgi:hypothetical protein
MNLDERVVSRGIDSRKKTPKRADGGGKREREDALGRRNVELLLLLDDGNHLGERSGVADHDCCGRLSQQRGEGAESGRGTHCRREDEIRPL